MTVTADAGGRHEGWLTEAARLLAFDAAARLVTGRPLDDLPLGRHVGRLPVELGRHDVAVVVSGRSVLR